MRLVINKAPKYKRSCEQLSITMRSLPPQGSNSDGRPSNHLRVLVHKPTGFLHLQVCCKVTVSSIIETSLPFATRLLKNLPSLCNAI